LFVNLRSPNPGAPTCPSTLKVLQTRQHTSTPSSIIFTFGLVVESIKKLGGVSSSVVNEVGKFNPNFVVPFS